jgi:hypothetical protein
VQFYRKTEFIMASLRVIRWLWFFLAFSAFGVSAEPIKKTTLYVGTQGGVNEGVVTTDQGHLLGTTKKIGYTIDEASAVPASEYVEVLVGTTGGVNAGVVTPNANHAGGSTTSIGVLSKKPIVGATKLYVGNGACNNGVITDNLMHLGCDTKFIGYPMVDK